MNIYLLALGTCVIPQAEMVHERVPFTLRRDIPTKGVRWDPHPRWVKIEWKPDGDIHYRAASQEASEVILSGLRTDPKNVWREKLRKAYADWYGDHQYTPKLHKVTCLMAIVRTVNPTFWETRECKEMVTKINFGYSFIRHVPPSYEFCRRAYLFNVGDRDYHDYERLAVRLLQRRPDDRSVIVGMVSEYYQRKPNSEFETVLFRSLDLLMKSPNKRPGDELQLALAYRMYGREHAKASSYDTAITILGRLLKDKDVEPEWPKYRNLIAEFEKEKKLPNFGKLPGAKYIGD